MNWLTIFILLSSIAGPLLVGWERIESHRLSKLTEGQEIRRDKLRRRTLRLVVAAAATTIILVGFNFAKTIRDQKSANDKATGLSKQLTQLSDENGELRDEVCNTRKALSDLLGVDSAKPTLDLSVRAEMLRVKREVDAGTKCTGNWGAIVATWSNKMAQAAQDRDKFHQATVTRQLKVIEPSVPVWDSTIKLFRSRLVEYLQPLNRKVIADCDGFQKRAEELAQGYYPESGWGDRTAKVCEMSVGTNREWSCVCETLIRERFPEAGGPCTLVLRSSWTNQQVTLDVSVRDQVISTSISSSGTSLSIDESHSAASNQTAMAGVIDDFIAAQASAFGVQP